MGFMSCTPSCSGASPLSTFRNGTTFFSSHRYRAVGTPPTSRSMVCSNKIAARMREPSNAGLVPIIEPEVSISSPHKDQAEMLLHDAIAKHVEALPEGATVMLKITIPTRPGLYGDLASDPRVLRVIALSGGYSRDEACARLARDLTLIASFSRALLEGLTENQTGEQFNAQLESSIEQIYQASVDKQPTSP